MFRRLPHSLPADSIVPADLAKLGYFVNDRDQIRMITKPEQKYQYKINRSDRVNDTHKEAMNTRIRQIVHEKFLNLDVVVLRLPLGSQPEDPHVPIYVSKNLKNKKRVIVIFGQRGQDLGIFSYRVVGDEGICTGSAVDIVSALLNAPGLKSNDDTPGIILANPGQLIWYRGGGRAVGNAEWLSLPRASAVHEQFRIDPIKNRVPDNKTYVEHIQYVFENVMTGEVHPDAKFDIIGVEYTGMAVMQHLAENWARWSGRITAICLGSPQHTIKELKDAQGANGAFMEFVKHKTRAYLVSDSALETPVAGVDDFGCNCYASGEKYYEENIIVRAWRSMLDWFNLVNAVPDYEEPTFTMVDVDDKDDELDRATF